MNFYSFHLGDYAAHTAHLEPMEDLAYRRMLDLYYRTEKALPVDVQEVGRLIRMRDCKAVEAVLSEFFELAADGWHSKRADAELTSMLEKQEQRAAKDEHEADRMRRYREKRAQMFTSLRTVGVVPAWDVPMKELQRLHDEHCNGPETDLQRTCNANCNAPATAIPIPLPIPLPLVDSGTALRVVPPPPPPAFDGKNAEALNGRSVVAIDDGFELPDAWGFDAEALGFKPAEVLREAERFRQYWTAGKGSGTRRSVKGWRQSWSNWLGKAAERQQR